MKKSSIAGGGGGCNGCAGCKGQCGRSSTKPGAKKGAITRRPKKPRMSRTRKAGLVVDDYRDALRVAAITSGMVR